MKIGLLAGLLIGLVSSCSSTPTAHLGGFSSTLDGGTEFGQLTQTQLQTFCNEVDSFDTSSGQDADLQKLLCLLSGVLAAEVASPLTDANVRSVCTAAYNQCLAQPPTQTFTCPSTASLAGCTATVAEYSACINDDAKAEITEVQALPSCGDLTVASLQPEAGAPPSMALPSSCQAVQQKCPNLAGGGAGNGGAAGTAGTGGGGAGGTIGAGGTAGAAGAGGAAGAAGAADAGATAGAGGADTICGFTMPNPVSAGLPHPASYDTGVAGIVTDRVSGLVWQRTPSSATYTREAAAAYCASQTVDNHSDWRVPSLIELVSLVDFTVSHPSIDGVTFPGTQAGSYWSSTVCASSSSDNWRVSFDDGSTSTSTVGIAPDPALVRCVRSDAAPPARCYSAGARYQAAGGLVADSATGLTWQQEVAMPHATWPSATSYCQSLGGGFRLPSVKELQTLLDLTVSSPGPTIDSTAFPSAPADFTWTSSLDVAVPTAVWEVYFGFGSIGGFGQNNTDPVRCVR
jgi:hypothetical protein